MNEEKRRKRKEVSSVNEPFDYVNTQWKTVNRVLYVLEYDCQLFGTYRKAYRNCKFVASPPTKLLSTISCLQIKENPDYRVNQ